MDKLAKVVSVILHPLFILNLGLFSMLRYHPYFLSKFYDGQFYSISLFIAINTLVMPLLSVYLLKRFKFIDDFQISNPKQRLMPYGIIAILLTFTTYQLYKNEIKGLPIHFLMATIICIIFNILLNIKFMVSSHTIASGGLVGLYMFLTIGKHISTFNPWLIIAVLLSGISAWSRLQLKAHSESQVYIGFLSGLTIVMLTLWIA
ncbi:MAG: hypothetical protein JNM67_11680 [Bacteroidetes bacterium]|nr:hypothetical protein [Bacteroidota bacterium]